MKEYQSNPNLEDSPMIDVKTVNSVRSALYVILGDLERYRQTYCVETKDWSQAAHLYRRAIRASPSEGKAFNQLAVVAFNRKIYFDAIYNYYRSLAVISPFPARDNIKSVHEAVRKELNKLQHMLSGRQLPADKLKTRLLWRFLRLHGMLFTHAEIDQFTVIYDGFMEDLRSMLTIQKMRHESGREAEIGKQSHLLTGDGIKYMLAVCIFSLHNSVQSFRGTICTEMNETSIFDAVSCLSWREGQEWISQSLTQKACGVVCGFLHCIYSSSIQPLRVSQGRDNIWFGMFSPSLLLFCLWLCKYNALMYAMDANNPENPLFSTLLNTIAQLCTSMIPIAFSADEYVFFFFFLRQ